MSIFNPQGNYKKVLCVCTSGLLRSPTAAFVLSQKPFNYNTRSAGVSRLALIRVNTELLKWCEEIIVMEREQLSFVKKMLKRRKIFKEVVCLDIPDKFDFREKKLVSLIKKRYKEISDKD